MGALPGAEMALDVTLWIVEGVRAGNDTSRDAEEGHPTLPSYTIMSGNKSPPSSASPIHGFPQYNDVSSLFQKVPKSCHWLVVSIDVLSRVLVYPHMSRSIPQLTPLGTTHCPRLLFWVVAWQVVCASISFLLTATLCRHQHKHLLQ